MQVKQPKAHGLYDPSFEKDSCGVGFIAHIKGQRSHQIVADANEMLIRMDHRGACGCEPNTGDGAGILTAIPDAFLQKACAEIGIILPEVGSYGTGNIFLPHDLAERNRMKKAFEKVVADEGQRFLGWRDVPTEPEFADLGPTAFEHRPFTQQPLIEAAKGLDNVGFERKLMLIRKRATAKLRMNEEDFYICSLSSRTIIYKGRLTPAQVVPYYTDLSDPEYTSHLALVHSRFSTNTFPSWDRAQPKRMMAHNGEINTLRGNVNWMHARLGSLESDVWGDELAKLAPIVEPETSDSGNFDNVLELLVMSGRTLPEAIAMMIPEAWENHDTMPDEKKAFYEYHACLMEPWDGPASISFTDGKYIGAVLDRNGLRPSRYYVTHDDRVMMASEVGVVPCAPELVKEKGRLQPGKMFLVNFEEGRIIPDEELKATLAAKNPYRTWLDAQLLTMESLNIIEEVPSVDTETLLPRLKAFGYTIEHLQKIIFPLIEGGKEPLGSMGNDAALAPFSRLSRLTYDYFQQHFAQVTNPPIDSTREYAVMALQTYIGAQANLLGETPESAHRLRLDHPVLSNRELAALKEGISDWKPKEIDITYPKERGVEGLEHALDRVCKQAEIAIANGVSILILTDRATNEARVPISTLLATGAIHHHLVSSQIRNRVALVLETGEAREVHHLCVLLGYGADAINPYLAFEAAIDAVQKGKLRIKPEYVIKNYKKAMHAGILKIMAKMGISTLASYKGAQIFEAVGLHKSVVEKCFLGTVSRIGGVGFTELAQEALNRHEQAFVQQQKVSQLDNHGEYHWRNGTAERPSEQHNWTPDAIHALQKAARTNSRDAYWDFAKIVDETAFNKGNIRQLLKFRKHTNAIPIEEVEPVSDIVKRFVTGAMSLGSISAEAHETLAQAMNQLGGKSNTGEGGEDYARFGDNRRSSIKQIASGRFGVTMWYLYNADELQIKMAQGAKPGEGGELPAHKVSEYIASVRRSTPEVGLISPPPHHDIYSIEDLSQLIHDLKNANPNARISVKLVSEAGVGTIAAGVAKAKADHILISGHDGGTGASPLNSIKHAGLPWELGLAETHQTLVMNDLRSRIVLQTDGQLKTGRDVVIAALLGAEEFGFATAPLITLGCIMMRKCHLNTCPVGVATQDESLRKKFNGTPEHVVNYLWMVAEHTRELLASLGLRSIREAVGRVDLLEQDADVRHWKSEYLDFSGVLALPQHLYPNTEVVNTQKQDHGLEMALDNELIRLAKNTLKTGESVEINLPIQNTDRVVGTMLSHQIMQHFGEKALPEDTIRAKFEGSAGQSFGAFAVQGLTLELEGDSNDYVGKGLSGGKVIVYPPKNATFKAEENVLVGNVCLYGGTSGEAYFRGRAAERFAVRNSGATAVVEGVGDHGCEYMTGGRVVILGSFGRNFAAGMSGGVAYVYDPQQQLEANCNHEMVGLETLTAFDDLVELRDLIKKHLQYTGSTVAAEILANWETSLTQFVKVMPHDYKRVLLAKRKVETEVLEAIAA